MTLVIARPAARVVLDRYRCLHDAKRAFDEKQRPTAQLSLSLAPRWTQDTRVLELHTVSPLFA